MQYKANSLPVNNVAKSYIESHLNLGTLLISQDIFYTDFESIKKIEQMFNFQMLLYKVLYQNLLCHSNKEEFDFQLSPVDFSSTSR